MKKSASISGSFLLWILFPFLGLLSAAKEIMQKKWSGFVSLTLFMSLVAFLIIPEERQDLYRIYERYELFDNLSFSGQLLMLASQIDFYLYGLFFLISYLGLPKEMIPFISVYIGYISFFYILYDWVIKGCKKLKWNEYIILFIFVFFSIPFRGYSLNIRSAVGMSFVLLGIYTLWIKGRKRGYLYLFLSPLCHISLFVVLPIVFLLQKIKNQTTWIRTFFIISFIGIFVNFNSLVQDYVLALNFENEELQGKQTAYFESGVFDNVSSGEGKNNNGMIALYWGYFMQALVLAYLWKNKKISSRLYDFSLVFMGLSNIFFHVSILASRFSLIGSMCFPLVVMEDVIRTNGSFQRIKYMKQLKVLALLFFLSWLMSLYTTRKSMSDCASLLYKPVLLLYVEKL